MRFLISDGYDRKRWPLPPDWMDVDTVALSRLTPDGPEPVGELATADGRLTLRMGKDEAIAITQAPLNVSANLSEKPSPRRQP